MNALQLKELKESLRLLSILFDKYLEHNNTGKTFPVYMVLSITLHNMCFDPFDCAGYDHEREVQKMYSGRLLFMSFAKYYPSHHTILWISEEVEMAVSYADIAEHLG